MVRTRPHHMAPNHAANKQSATEGSTTYDIGNLAFGDRESGHRLKPEHDPTVKHDRSGNGENRHVPRIDPHRSHSR